MKKNVRCYFNGNCNSYQNERIIAPLLEKVGVIPDNKAEIVRIFSDLQLDGKLGHLVRNTINLKCNIIRAVTDIAHVSETDEQSIGLMAFGWICSVVADPNFSLAEVRKEILQNANTLDLIFESEDRHDEEILEKLGDLLDKIRNLALLKGPEKEIFQKAIIEDMLFVLSDDDFVKECKLDDLKKLCEKALKE